MANKIVLKGLSATNFGSFAEKMTFTTVVDKSKKESEINAFKEGDDYINKVSFIYGANGAGKTYFCKVLREMQRMIFVSPFSMMEQSQKKRFYRMTILPDLCHILCLIQNIRRCQQTLQLI